MRMQVLGLVAIGLLVSNGAISAQTPESVYDANLLELSSPPSVSEDLLTYCQHGRGGGSYGVYGEVELLFLKYLRADGIRIGTDATETGQFDLETSPRFTLGGALDSDGLGLRVRYWEYDHKAGIEDAAAGDHLGVDTYNIDFELYQTFQWSSCWSLELAGGLRYNDFTETMVDVSAGDVRRISSDGWGPTLGFEIKRRIRIGSLYARARGALLVLENKRIFNQDGGVVNQDFALSDSTAGMIEIGIGYELDYELANGSVVFGRVGGEFQQWLDYSHSFGTGGAGGNHNEGFFDDSSNVGFAGLLVSVGLRR